ncbi:hypothetical protein [Nocardia sp. NPDC003963]
MIGGDPNPCYRVGPAEASRHRTDAVVAQSPEVVTSIFFAALSGSEATEADKLEDRGPFDLSAGPPRATHIRHPRDNDRRGARKSEIGRS